MRILDCLNYTKKQRRARLSENKQAINQNKPLHEVREHEYFKSTRIALRTLLLEVFKNTNSSNRTNSPVDLAAGGEG